jgi:putative ABC transport system ATP-binding protein
MANPLIQITNIKRDFVLGNEIVYVLKGIDLQINKGEYVALMGPSGSGKSTLMNLLGCLDTPTSGSYILNGKMSAKCEMMISRFETKKLDLFSNLQPLPRTTALDNVALPMIYAGFQNRNENKSYRSTRTSEPLMNGSPTQPTFWRTTPACGYARALVNKPLSSLPMSPGNLDSKTSLEIMKLLETSMNEIR